MSYIHIGTSGWHYSHWRGPFYPPDATSSTWLDYYAQHLHCVEINSSFYKLPDADTLKAWSQATPDDFLFAVKAGQNLTHRKKLKQCADGVHMFLHRVAVLGDKCGPVLFQLPPRWRCNLSRLAEFLELLPDGPRYSFEFRDPSWHNSEVNALLAEHNAAFCIYDLAGFQSPLNVTADFVYVRLHGPGKEAYTGSYRIQSLRRWADHLQGWARQRRHAFLFFDNDESGYAARNALKLSALVYGAT